MAIPIPFFFSKALLVHNVKMHMQNLSKSDEMKPSMVSRTRNLHLSHPSALTQSSGQPFIYFCCSAWGAVAQGHLSCGTEGGRKCCTLFSYCL